MLEDLKLKTNLFISSLIVLNYTGCIGPLKAGGSFCYSMEMLSTVNVGIKVVQEMLIKCLLCARGHNLIVLEKDICSSRSFIIQGGAEGEQMS